MHSPTSSSSLRTTRVALVLHFARHLLDTLLLLQLGLIFLSVVCLLYHALTVACPSSSRNAHLLFSLLSLLSSSLAGSAPLWRAAVVSKLFSEQKLFSDAGFCMEYLCLSMLILLTPPCRRRLAIFTSFFQTALFIISLFPFSPLFLALFCLFSPVVWLPPLGRTNSPNLLTFTSSVLIMSSIRPVPSVPLPAMLTHHHHRRCLVMGSTVRPIKVKLASSHHHSTATSPIEEWTTALEEPTFSFSSFLLLWQFVALDCHEFSLFIRESALNSRAHHEPVAPATTAAVTVSPLLSASLANCDHDANLELKTSLQCYVYSSFLHSPALTCLVIYIISNEWTTAAAAGSAGACFVGLLCDNLLSLSCAGGYLLTG